MLIKRIVCEVDATNAEAFAKAQSQWGALSHVNGFIKQAGRKQQMGCSPQRSSAFGRTELPMITLWRTNMTAYTRKTNRKL